MTETIPTLLIALVGGRIQPAVITAVHMRPDAIACIVSRDKEKRAAELQTALSRLMSTPDWTVTIPVDPYSIADTRQSLDDIIRMYPNHRIIVSLTSAPQPMILGAYYIAQQNGCPAYYLISSEGKLVDYVHEDAGLDIKITLSVEDFIHSHNMAIADKEPPHRFMTTSAQHIEAIQILASDILIGDSLLDFLDVKKHINSTQRKEWTLSESHRSTLDALAETGIIRGLQFSEADGKKYVKYRIPHQQDRQFLESTWLEIYTYHAATSLVDDGTAVFDDCAFSVKFESEQSTREIDFVGTRSGAAIIASCKTGKNATDKSHLDELKSAGERLGGNYTVKLFVTNKKCPNAGEKGETHGKQAADSGIVVVYQEDLPNLAAILSRELVSPTYART